MHGVHIVLHVPPGMLLHVLWPGGQKGWQNPGCHGGASQTSKDQDNYQQEMQTTAHVQMIRLRRIGSFLCLALVIHGTGQARG